MGLTRTDLYPEEALELAELAKALGHPARMAILLHLLRCNACINSDLVQELGLAQATISQHLKALKEVGLIQGSIEGTRMNYCINPQRWGDLKGKFSALFARFQGADAPPCC